MNRFVIKIGFLIALVICIIGLRKENNTFLDEALVLAEENRPELEKVLRHYSSRPQDSLKLKAATFLIENMPGHYSYKNNEFLTPFYNEIEAAVDTAYDNMTNKKIIEEISRKYISNKANQTVWDCHIITARYLIDNIERAFKVWEKGEWATHVTFDDFCEYILPYKSVELQPLDNWREYAQEMVKGDLDTLHYCDLYKNSAYHASTTVSKEIIKLNKQELPMGGIKSIPIKNIKTLAKMPFGTCNDYSILAMAVMRSKGIPVMEDFTPQWPFQPQSHSWNIVLLNKGKNMVFSAGSSNPGELHNPDAKMAKVFRNCYAINREIRKIHSSEQDVPPTFQNYFIKDVTDEYFNTSDVEIKIPSQWRGKHQYAYLAVFDNKNWIPVHYGEISGSHVTFEKMGRGCMYLPVFYSDEYVIPFSEPFHITATGEVKRYNTSDNLRKDITVRRKYFVAGHCYEVGHRMEGGIFQASNQSDFKDAVTIYQVPGFTVQSGEILLDTLNNEYRYWRYYSSEGKYNNLAELYFFKKGTEKPLYGEVIGTNGSYTNRKSDEKEAVFDNDPLTFFDAPTPSNTWVGMDFGQPTKINRICYTPRGDGNDITPGDIHELFYWKNSQWVSLGKREEWDIKLVYKNVPANTIY